MVSRANRTLPLQGAQMAECLRAQARLCAHIASECWNEETASEFVALGRECADAAALKQPGLNTIRAAWPLGLAAARKAS